MPKDQRAKDVNQLRKFRVWIGDDGQVEQLCDHGVGHRNHPHTCDGCCSTKLNPLKQTMEWEEFDKRFISKIGEYEYFLGCDRFECETNVAPIKQFIRSRFIPYSIFHKKIERAKLEGYEDGFGRAAMSKEYISRSTLRKRIEGMKIKDTPNDELHPQEKLYNDYLSDILKTLDEI